MTLLPGEMERWPLWLAAGCALAAAPLGAWAQAASPPATPSAQGAPTPANVTYRVDFASTGDAALDDTLRASSQLEALRSSAPVDAWGLIARARGDERRLKTVLGSFGYYKGSVHISVGDEALDTPAIAESLAAGAGGRELRIRVAATRGPLYHLGAIRLEGAIPEFGQQALGLASGAPAVAADVLAAGARLQGDMQDAGYAFARVEEPVAWEDPERELLDIDFKVEPGPRVHVGVIRIAGLGRVHESLVRRRLLLATDAPYNASDVERARRDLLALGVFSTVTVELGRKPDAQGRVPITFRVRERRRHAVAINAAWSSDLGGSGGVSWTDRNLFGNGEQLSLAASVINAGGSAASGLGYDTSARLLIPDFGRRDQTLQLSLSGLHQSLLAYDQRSETAGFTLTRRLSHVWSASAGVNAGHEAIVQHEFVLAGTKLAADDVRYEYSLLALPVSLLYDSTDLPSPLADPVHGLRGALTLTPTLSVGRPSSWFLISQLTLAGYFDLERLTGNGSGRDVLALRVLSGVAQGASTFQLPPDERFYAGGSGTVRGYRYQSVGPLFLDQKTPQGGVSLAAVNAEYRRRIGRSLGYAVFADAGGASSHTSPFDARIRIGVGAGIRYYTPIGPVRVDIAFPTSRRRSVLDGRATDDRFEVYIGLGQAF